MYGVISTVPAPVEMYDTLHGEILRRVGFIDGLLVHIGRATTDGFQMLEVWESKEHYDRPHETSLEAFRYARECTAQILERLTEDQWLREGTHSESGPYSVHKWLKIYSEHAHSHARQIVEARDAAKKAS